MMASTCLDRSSGEGSGAAAADGETAAAQPTSFRLAEKRYQLKREQVYRNRNGRRYGAGLRAQPTDLSGVLDFSLLDGRSAAGGVSGADGQPAALLGPSGQDVLPCRETSQHLASISGVRVHAADSGQEILSFRRFPGLYVLPGAVSQADQQKLASDCLKVFPEPPSNSNHTAHLGPLHNLWDSALKGLRVIQRQSATNHDDSGSRITGNSVGSLAALQEPQGATALQCLEKLRWITLGPQFDWTKRVYDMDGPHQQLPETLQHLAQWAAGAALQVEKKLCREGWDGEFKPEACLVNYYGEGDTLNGHRDDVEPNQSLPIISISLGCSAVFLMGEQTLDAVPLPMIVRSGDVVVLGAEARKCYHGVPRVLAAGKLGKSFQEAAAESPEAAMAVYLSHKRINLSVRTIT